MDRRIQHAVQAYPAFLVVELIFIATAAWYLDQHVDHGFIVAARSIHSHYLILLLYIVAPILRVFQVAVKEGRSAGREERIPLFSLVHNRDCCTSIPPYV